jgi:tRNA-2-methylthio-N6-dimethylallyladenosine synthase
MSRELIAVIGRQEKICPHVHLAVQSGDDDILKAMNRKYTAAHFEKLVAALRRVRPGIALTTDVIVGFPGETRKQFDNTRRLFRRVRFDLAYIARYSPRPGTVSARLTDNVTAAEKKRREQELDEVLKKYAGKNTERLLGQEIEFLVEGLDKKGRYYGKAASYQTVLAYPGNNYNAKGIISSFARAHITKAMPFALEGELVSGNIEEQ